MITRFSFTLILLYGLSGCAGLASSETMSSSPPDEIVHADVAKFHQFEGGGHVIDPETLLIPLEDLKEGQRVRLVTFVSTPAEIEKHGSLDMTEYIGTIRKIDDGNIVLKDAVVMNSSTPRGTPVVNHVPYLSRLFRSTSPSKITTALPTGVTIPRSRVIVALRPDTMYTERIGVDFE